MAFFCETNYECWQQMACYQYCWEGDTNIPKCNHCDNCLRQQQDNVILTDLENETLLMASIIHELLKKSKESGGKLEKVKKEDVIDVFFGANNKNVKNNDLNTIEGFGSGKKSNIKKRDIGFYFLEKMVLKGLVKHKIIVKHLVEGSTGFTHSEELVDVMRDQEAVDFIRQNNWKILLSGNQRRG